MNQISSDSVHEQTTGIILVDHGSRRAESNDLLIQVADFYRQHTRAGRPEAQWPIVEPAHMELAEPSIAAAFDKCVEQGARKVVVMPYFLSPGKHWFKDIPELTRQAAQKHPGVAYLVTAPLGLHPLIAQIIDARVGHCVRHTQGLAGECDVCAGSGRCVMTTVQG